MNYLLVARDDAGNEVSIVGTTDDRVNGPCVAARLMRGREQVFHRVWQVHHGPLADDILAVHARLAALVAEWRERWESQDCRGAGGTPIALHGAAQTSPDTTEEEESWEDFG